MFVLEEQKKVLLEKRFEILFLLPETTIYYSNPSYQFEHLHSTYCLQSWTDWHSWLFPFSASMNQTGWYFRFSFCLHTEISMIPCVVEPNTHENIILLKLCDLGNLLLTAIIIISLLWMIFNSYQYYTSFINVHIKFLTFYNL